MTHIEQRYGPSTEWTAQNPVLHAGEAGHESDTGKSKMGDGETPWNDLLYKGGVDSVAGKTGEVELDIDDVSGAAPLVSPAFTGSPTAPTRATSDDSTNIATTEFVKNQGYATAIDTALEGEPTAPNPDPAEDSTAIATTAWVRDLILAMHPVGSIKMTDADVNPGTYLGGTWVPWGAGRVPVGVDETITEFDEANKIGGEMEHILTEAELPHLEGRINLHGTAEGSSMWDPSGVFSESPAAPNSFRPPPASTTGASSLTRIEFDNAGQDEGHNNLQPYITCYMFKRTS